VTVQFARVDEAQLQEHVRIWRRLSFQRRAYESYACDEDVCVIYFFENDRSDVDAASSPLSVLIEARRFINRCVARYSIDRLLERFVNERTTRRARLTSLCHE
jgi:hypothetical protein